MVHRLPKLTSELVQNDCSLGLKKMLNFKGFKELIFDDQSEKLQTPKVLLFLLKHLTSRRLNR